ncbi:HlyD family secretion protein [Gluconobacter wancherniae]|uniref:HlyD family secretion protein n=1 Tax=Gluconobacter wancherniae TaxID=1307955 RepID=UPI001B8BD4C3|nr:HlyD family secretion protein [Gluconobacter wancherniae]MBS1064123.1 HlyD family secretion protein [Gluconobacter wancherniae]
MRNVSFQKEASDSSHSDQHFIGTQRGEKQAVSCLPALWRIGYAPYVLANYRETELAPLRVGQQALVRVDALGGRRLHGHVDSFQSGTGSRFALLPPQNATGNFIKVVQRVPVKIVLDELPQSGALLAPGMSVETEVFFAGRPHWLELFE